MRVLIVEDDPFARRIRELHGARIELLDPEDEPGFLTAGRLGHRFANIREHL
jgi:hypothetical protein